MSSSGAGLPEALTSEQVLPSHDCQVCNIEQPLKSGSDTVPSDWATLGVLEPWDSKMEIPAK